MKVSAERKYSQACKKIDVWLLLEFRDCTLLEKEEKKEKKTFFFLS
jgi:hypothetical protein